MKRLLVAGAGQVGRTVAHLAVHNRGYHIYLADQQFDHIPEYYKTHKRITLLTIDTNNQAQLADIVTKEKIDGVLSCLPYFCNKAIADVAAKTHIHYFDLTEDIEITDYVKKLSEKSDATFTPQCGLAPGLIDIIANDLMQDFDELDTVKLRCGGLPIHASNELKYAFTWSVDGLINEYNHPCYAIKNGERLSVPALEGIEEIQIDGLEYEAFNTSGGIGSLADTYKGKVNNINYKTMRYPGHRDRIRFLMHDLKLGEDTDLLKKILINAIPFTTDDVVIVFVSVSGKKHDILSKNTFVRKFYPHTIDSIKHSALQVITAASALAVIDIIINHPKEYTGFVLQEQFSLDQLLKTPYSQYIKEN